jgi:hypothetical protein
MDTPTELQPTKRLKTKRLKTKRLKTRRQTLRKFMNYKQTQQKTFVDLANEHFMNSNLEMVQTKYHFSKGNVNIFIIGEIHGTRNYTAIGIYEAFETFYDIVKDTIQVDILIEASDDYINKSFIKYRPYNDYINQINNVRTLFYDCMFEHNCNKVKVHWIDGDYSNNDEMVSKKFEHRLAAETHIRRNALAEMPPWIRTFLKDNVNKNGSLKENPELIERFKTMEGVLTLLTENTIVMKELDKSHEIEGKFDLAFAIKFLTRIYEIAKKENKILDVARAVIDIYTVARMIKSQMKNVIIYNGAFHSDNVAMILTQLSYTLNSKFPNSRAEKDEQRRLCSLYNPASKSNTLDDWHLL